ncbi:MAG: phosphoglycerate kinase [Acidobacteria bacterium]|nr:MAG: phosphoglycerate kinase [Acidobacteriota bacterium]
MKQTIRDLQPAGQTVFLRVDFNVPMHLGTVTDDSRVAAAVPTISELSRAGARVLCASHLGRPQGNRRQDLSLETVATVLGDHLGRKVLFVPESHGPQVEQFVAGMGDGDVALLENLRFDPGEEKNDPALARKLAAPASIYVNDAFGTAHRAHASTAAITRFLSPAVAGLLLQREVTALSRLLGHVDRPYIVVLGGAKISGKIDLMESLMEQADAILVGGAMSYTLLRAQGLETGQSLVEEDQIEMARHILERAGAQGVELVLPLDHLVAPAVESDTATTTDGAAIPADLMACDVGPRTVDLFTGWIRKAATILWNGPMGIFENPRFAAGTRGIGAAIAASSSFSVVGGGDSVAAVRQFQMENGFSHLSTGGGASLEFLAGRALPGLVALAEKDN